MSDWGELLPYLESPALLVTLVSLQGSNYRRPGARLLVLADGSTRGLLSGGCLEEAVSQRVVGLWEEPGPLLWQLDTRPYSGCDGRLTLLAEHNPALLEQVGNRLRQRQCDGFVVSTAQGSRITDQLEEMALLCRPLQPLVRFVVIGGGPDSLAMRELGHGLGWQVEHLCHPEHKHPLPGCQAVAPETLAHWSWDQRTAVILMNHHLGRDAAFLTSLWKRPLGYLACIGSRARREELLQALWNSGVEPEGREFFCPAGLLLNGEGPQAVALSVLAQVQQCLHRV
jgi:xanthine dehydrogenase accessory factor